MDENKLSLTQLDDNNVIITQSCKLYCSYVINLMASQ